jgi:hypothetical protein
MPLSEVPTQVPLPSHMAGADPRPTNGTDGFAYMRDNDDVWVFSGRSVLRMAGCNVVCQARIPALELWPESAVECPRAHLEQQACATRDPLHLLTLAKRWAITAFTRGFGQA